MKVISETCHAHLIQYLHLYWCEVPDECYFRNVSCTLNSISTFVLVWGTWWKLFQKRVMHTYFNIYICIDVRYLMKVISETYHAHLIQYLHLYWYEVPDEGYFRNVSCTFNSIFTFVLVWGTWWKLFQKRVMNTEFNIYIFIDVRYLMKVILETCHAHLIQYLHLYWCKVPDESYFRNVSYTLNSISTFELVWSTWWKLFQKRVMHT